jgi:hypothetical protein
MIGQRAGLVVPHERAALEAGMARILDDRAFAAQLREGCNEVKNSLSWAEPLAQMETLYQTLISEYGAK